MTAKEYITFLKNRWKRIKGLEVVLKSIAFALILLACCNLFFYLSPLYQSLLFLLFAGGFGYLLALKWKLFSLNESFITKYLNQHYKELQYSAQLLFQGDESLSLPARMQKRRVEMIVKELEPQIKVPNKLKDSLLYLAVAFLLFFLLMYFQEDEKFGRYIPSFNLEESQQQADEQMPPQKLEEAAPQIKKARIWISPPKYTGINSYSDKLAEVKAPENSKLTFQLSLSEDVEKAWLKLHDGDSLRFRKSSKGDYLTQISLKENSFYQVLLQSANGKQVTTSFFALEAIEDQLPIIQIMKPQQQYVVEKASRPFPIHVQVNDDYGLKNAYIKFIISSGSGESVTFREETVWFDSSLGKSSEKRAKVDPVELKMQPGDELYFFVEAYDNKEPTMQKAKSETYVYRWINPTEEDEEVLAIGMAMDMMPEYFRSQRQIIIDTERLIKEKENLTEEAFQNRCNELGTDQKLLRLRYGKFLGEEFESGYAEGDEEAIREGIKKMQEKKEEEHEEGSHYEGDGHDHEQHADGSLSQPANPLAAYMHAHDTEEGATFYEESIKVKLKAALAQMWDAELKLRTLKPKEALPYEYKALEIIKDIQQTTRIYVERVGFDPPPLKPEEKRLTGDQEEIASSVRKDKLHAEDSLPAVRQALHILNKKKITLTEKEKGILQKAGNEYAALVLKNPSLSLKPLQQLSVLLSETTQKKEKENARHLLAIYFYRIVPESKNEIKGKTTYPTALQRSFLKQLGNASN